MFNHRVTLTLIANVAIIDETKRGATCAIQVDKIRASQIELILTVSSY